MSPCLESCDVTCGTDHVRFTRPSGSVFAYCKRSKTGAEEGLGTRLIKICDGKIWISTLACHILLF